MKFRKRIKKIATAKLQQYNNTYEIKSLYFYFEYLYYIVLHKTTIINNYNKCYQNQTSVEPIRVKGLILGLSDLTRSDPVQCAIQIKKKKNLPHPIPSPAFHLFRSYICS